MAALREFLPRLFLCGSLALVGAPVSAGVVSTEQIAVSTDVAATPETQRQALTRELESQGVAPDEAQERVGAMSDEEVLALAGKIDALPAGGALSNTELLLLIIIILLVAL